MARKLSAWNLFVKKIYQEGKAKNKNYEFKQALEDASKRKSEMGNMSSSDIKSKKKGKKSYSNQKKSKKRSGGNRVNSTSGGKTRKHK